MTPVTSEELEVLNKCPISILLREKLLSMTKARTPLAVLTLSGVLFTPFWVALAEPSKTPRIEGAMPIEWQSDFAHHSDDATNERNNMFIKAEPEITLYLPAGFSIFAHGVLQQVKAAGPDEDRYFKDEALLIEDLFLRYENGPFILTGGKLNPGFGKAWDVTPGVYGADTAEDYEIAERIGLTAAFGFGDEIWGQHQFTAGTFFTDTTPLAHSFGQTRGTTALSDGGVSNTEDFSSFNLVLEGSGIQSLPGLEYHLAYISQANGTDGTTDETGVAAFAAYGTIAFVQGQYNLATFCGVIAGALLSFLWFNINPARFFMGDTGAMSLGVALGIVAMLTGYPLLLPIIGFLLMLETLSVIIQLASKKIRKKKVFLSAPIHHHFEALDWGESKVTMRLWITGSFFAFIGVLIGLFG
mgnify:CR=1 FL=1